MSRSSHQAIAAWIFGSISFALLGGLLVFGYDQLKDPLVRFFASLCAGLFGFFLTGTIRLFSDGTLPKIGKLGVQATGGAALFVLVWLTWPAQAIPQPVSLQRLELFVQRAGVEAIEPLVLVAGRHNQSAPPIEPLEPDDAFRLVGRLSRAAHWALIWIDSGGKPTVASASTAPSDRIEYPGEAQGITINAQDPTGWHALSLILSDRSLSKPAETWSSKLTGIGIPPKPPPRHWSQLLLGADEVVSMATVPYAKFRDSIDTVLPESATQAFLLFLPWKSRH